MAEATLAIAFHDRPRRRGWSNNMLLSQLPAGPVARTPQLGSWLWLQFEKRQADAAVKSEQEKSGRKA
jgi:hypothetical protein